jgi:plastocyanin
MRTLSLTALLCALAIAAAGCGGDNDNSSGSGSSNKPSSGSSGGGTSGGGASGKGQTLKLSADAGGALKFDKSSLTAKAGKVTIVLDNPSSLPHAVELEGNGLEEKKSDTINKGETTKVTATVKAGKYEYYCPVDGHKAGGMTGELTVQ